MLQRLKELDSSLLILDAQRQLRKTHATPAMVPKLPADPDARRTLTKNLEDMGCCCRESNTQNTQTNTKLQKSC